MRVEMTTKIGGTRNGEEWPDKGGVVDLPDHEALDLIAAGYAKEASDVEAPVEAPEPAEDGDEAPASDGDAPEPAEPVKPARKRPAKKA